MHEAKTSIELVKQTFGNWLIALWSEHPWEPCSPDSSPLGSCCKENVYKTRSQTIAGTVGKAKEWAFQWYATTFETINFDEEISVWKRISAWVGDCEFVTFHFPPSPMLHKSQKWQLTVAWKYNE